MSKLCLLSNAVNAEERNHTSLSRDEHAHAHLQPHHNLWKRSNPPRVFHSEQTSTEADAPWLPSPTFSLPFFLSIATSRLSERRFFIRHLGTCTVSSLVSGQSSFALLAQIKQTNVRRAPIDRSARFRTRFVTKSKSNHPQKKGHERCSAEPLENSALS